MAKLADLLKPSVLTTSGMDAAWLMKFAEMLEMTVDRASELFKEYGCGQIYTLSGIVMEDNPRNRHRCSGLSGGCVIVGGDMQIWARTAEDIGRVGRAKHKMQSIQRSKMIWQDEKEYRESRRLKKLIDTVTTDSCPKRQGKANSHSDIGRYVNTRSPRLMEFAERSRVVKFENCEWMKY